MSNTKQNLIDIDLKDLEYNVMSKNHTFTAIIVSISWLGR